MTLDEIRKQLLDDHARLRELARSVNDQATRLFRGTAADVGALRVALAALHEALGAHNAREEELLRDVLPTIDAWGPRREELMDERHASEHAALQATLTACSELEDRTEAAIRAHDAVELLLAHIVQEERELLAEDVLSDGFIKVDFGGP